MTGWGAGSWGTSTWGSGGPSELELGGATATSERTVKVFLSKSPRSLNPISVGDALNPKTWRVVRGDTGQSLIVLAVQRIDPETFELYTLRKFGSVGVTHTVSTETLVDPMRQLVVLPAEADFLGMVASEVVGQEQSLVDIKNSPFGEPGQVAGLMRVDSSGNYVLHGGAELLRKLVIRRLTTSPGGFFHLPGYGLGLRVKEPLSIPDLAKLKSEVERQILREPELEAAVAALSLDRQGILTVRVKARVAETGLPVETELEIPTFVAA